MQLGSVIKVDATAQRVYNIYDKYILKCGSNQWLPLSFGQLSASFFRDFFLLQFCFDTVSGFFCLQAEKGM